jgi:hypothetical protein
MNIEQQAFPDETNYGMTLRDYFAAKAMGGIMAIPDHWYQNNSKDIAEDAYVMADAMLKARTE